MSITNPLTMDRDLQALGGGILLVLLRPLIDRFSHFVGVEEGTSVLFALGILFLIVVSMYLSVHITALEDKVEALAEDLAMVKGVRNPPSDAAPPSEDVHQ